MKNWKESCVLHVFSVIGIANKGIDHHFAAINISQEQRTNCLHQRFKVLANRLSDRPMIKKDRRRLCRDNAPVLSFLAPY
jgi:hypothetical protein